MGVLVRPIDGRLEKCGHFDVEEELDVEQDLGDCCSGGASFCHDNAFLNDVPPELGAHRSGPCLRGRLVFSNVDC